MSDDILPLKPEILHILLWLSTRERHGYAILKDVEEATDGAIRLRPSPLYRRLRRLLELGLIQEAEERPDGDADDERRRYYRITEEGREILAAEARRVTRLAADERIRRLARAGVRGDHG